MATPEEHSPCDIYQFHILLLQISPAIWRRILIRSDSSIADLQYPGAAKREGNDP